MPFVDTGDVVSGTIITEGWGDQVRANFLAGVPAIFSVKGDLAVATAPLTAARLAVGADDATLVADSGTATGLAWQIQPAAYVTNSAALLMAPEVWTSIAFDTETSDTDAMHAAAPNPSRLTIPAGGAGWYTFGFNGNASRAAVNTAYWMARIILGGVTVLAQSRSSATRPAYLNLSLTYPLAVGDFIEVQYYSDAVADQSIAIGAAFYAVWQRRP